MNYGAAEETGIRAEGTHGKGGMRTRLVSCAEPGKKAVWPEKLIKTAAATRCQHGLQY